MGRDWAPFEHYLVEQRQIKQGHDSFWDMVKSSEIYLAGKEPELMYSDEEIALRRRFPFIGKFLFDNFPDLYGQLSKIEGGIDFLHAKDLELATIIENKGHGCDESSYLVKWFAGKLDENFYYSERNNQLFVEEMVKEAVLKVLENAAAIEYKGIIFDDWAVDATGDMKGIWAEMCQCCAEKYKDLLSDELDDAGAMGVCSVKGCGVVGADTDYEHHYYIDFKPELIKPLSLEELLKKQGVEILEYDTKAKERFEDLVDVMSPQECADLFGKPVRCGDEIFMPKGIKFILTARSMFNDDVSQRSSFLSETYCSLEEAKDKCREFEKSLASHMIAGIEEVCFAPGSGPVKTGSYWELHRGQFEKKTAVINNKSSLEDIIESATVRSGVSSEPKETNHTISKEVEPEL